MAAARTEPEWLALIEQRRVAVSSALRQAGGGIEALRLALDDPPLQIASAPAKEANASVVAAAALALRESELVGAVASLSVDECELLLKYVYRALAKPSEKSAAWLKWHATLLERTGPGAIVRVITEMGSTV